MRILYVTPGLGPCGGIRVIVEHLNRLSARGHEVFVATPGGETDRPGWIDLNEKVLLATLSVYETAPMDVAVATGWMTVPYVANNLKKVGAKVWFNQMAEWLFYDPGTPRSRVVKSYYESWDDPMINISEWVSEEVGRSEYMLGNGVNKDHFHTTVRRKANAILIEGDDRNYAKDQEGIAWSVGERLRKECGVKLWGYAGYSHSHAHIFDDFVVKPTVSQMRDMYSQALFLLKASRYDARACAPVEAMCCGTPTVRAIIKGDDDLEDFENCIKCQYDEDELYEAAIQVLGDKELLDTLTDGAIDYADEELNWSDKIDKLEETLQDVV